MYANRRHFRVMYEMGVEKHDGSVRFSTERANMAVSCMHNVHVSGHYIEQFVHCGRDYGTGRISSLA